MVGWGLAPAVLIRNAEFVIRNEGRASPLSIIFGTLRTAFPTESAKGTNGLTKPTQRSVKIVGEAFRLPPICIVGSTTRAEQSSVMV